MSEIKASVSCHDQSERAFLYAAAKRAGKPFSQWAREILLSIGGCESPAEVEKTIKEFADEQFKNANGKTLMETLGADESTSYADEDGSTSLEALSA